MRRYLKYITSVPATARACQTEERAPEGLPARGLLAKNARRPKARREAGGTLFLTLVITIAVGVVSTSYVTLVSENQKSVVRSEAWNTAMVVAEAGIEEALAHLNRNFPTNLLTGGWSIDGLALAQKRPFGDGYYEVRVSLSTNPVITSSGYVRLPWNDTYVSRTVRVPTVLTNVIYNAIATKEDIKQNGFRLRTDSYDSGDSDYSGPGGRYDPRKTKDGGDVATNLGGQVAVNSGNSQIYGKLSTGANGSFQLGPGASIGSDLWHESGYTGVEPGWSNDDANVPMPDVTVPFTGGLPGLTGLGFDYVFGSGNYAVDSLSGKIHVTGDAVIIVRQRLQITGTDFIRIAPGASLKLYVAASSATIGGLGVINTSGLSTQFQYFGLPTNTKLTVSGGSQLAGFIYAPNADFILNGTGNVFGATMTRTLTMNGDFGVSFDEALKRLVTINLFRPIFWEEI